MIENGKPVGVVLTMEEYELLCSSEAEKLSIPEINSEPVEKPQNLNLIGEAMVREMNFPEASAEFADIETADNIALEDLGLDELPY